MRIKDFVGVSIVIGTVICMAVISISGQEPRESMAEDEVYRASAEIKLELDRIRLALIEQGAGGEEIIAAVDEWLTANEKRLETNQEEMAKIEKQRNVDRPAPLAPVPDLTRDPRENEIAQIQYEIDVASHQAKGSTADPLEAQAAFDIWMKNPANSRKLERMRDLGKQMTAERHRNPDPVVIEVPLDPTADELAAADIQQEMAQRELKLVIENPDATPLEMQTIREANGDFFAEKMAALRETGKRIQIENLRRSVSELEIQIEKKPAQPSKK